MSEKHTPGPWATDESEHDMPYQDIRIHSGKRGICVVWLDDAPVHDYNAEQQANARLISVAPDLLEALKRIDDMCAAPPNFRTATIQDVARAAIAKVTGVAL